MVLQGSLWGVSVVVQWLTQVGWVSRGGEVVLGGVNEQPRRAVKGLRRVRWGLV